MTFDPAHRAVILSDTTLCRARIDNGRLMLRLTNDDSSLGVAQPLLHSFLADTGVDASAIYRTELVFEELVTNIIRYAYAGRANACHPIDATAEVRALVIELVVEDEGPVFDMVKAPVRPIPVSLDASQIGGHGLRFIHAFTTSLAYERAGNRNRVTALIARD